MSALPGYIDLFRYCQGVIDLNAEIPDCAFDLGIPSKSWTALRLPVRR
jgi:hypothetical protein